MPPHHRIVWNEGLFLTPHHFQQWDLHHSAELVERAAFGQSHFWGVFSMEVDLEKLARGNFHLLGFRGLFPSGESVHVPNDSSPVGVSFKEAFDIKADVMDIYLGLPVRWSEWPNCVLPGAKVREHRESRYRAAAATVPDDNTGTNERSILRAEQNLKILLGTDIRDNYDVIRIAQVARAATGTFELVEEYAPPCLTLQSSPYLKSIVQSLLAMLSTRSTKLAEDFPGGASDITLANLKAYLHYSVVNGAIPLLAHLKDLPVAHPERLYTLLASLAGGLATFRPDVLHPRDVPPYDHEQLGEIFGSFKDLILRLLEIGDTQGYELIPLELVGEGRWRAVFQKDKYVEPAVALYLAVTAEDEDAAGVVRLMRLAAPDRIQQLIERDLPGLPLNHDPSPPAVIPRRRGTSYFKLETRGGKWDPMQHWEAIRGSRKLAIDLPTGVGKAQFELLAL